MRRSGKQTRLRDGRCDTFERISCLLKVRRTVAGDSSGARTIGNRRSRAIRVVNRSVSQAFLVKKLVQAMHRVQRAIRAAFLAATLIAFVRVSVADSRLSLQCKNIARDVIINSCKGPRIKRATPRLDLEMMDDEISKLEPTGELGFVKRV